MTIDAIVAAVTRELAETEAGIERVKMMDKLVACLDDKSLRAARRHLHRRPSISFSVNTFEAQRARPTISGKRTLASGPCDFARAAEVTSPCSACALRTLPRVRPAGRVHDQTRYSAGVNTAPWADA
jgi:hypothetical protein